MEIHGVARVGFSRNFAIYVVTDAGDAPYFCITSLDDSCNQHFIKLLDAEYAIYLKEIETLDTDQIKEIYKFMKSKPKIKGFEDIFDTNWELACMLWDINNENYKIPKDVTMPDYRQLR